MTHPPSGSTEQRSDAQGIYDRLGGAYDAWTRLPDRLILNRMRRELLSKAKGHVLEVAIGTGKNLAYYPKGCYVTGLDIATKPLDKAMERAVKLNLDFTAETGNAVYMRFPAASFDTVVCTLGGCTFPDAVAVFREMHRVCRPDGRVLFLEHVRPKTSGLRKFAEIAAPFTMRFLHCDPTRDTEASIRRANLQTVEKQTAFNEMLIALVTEPLAIS